MDKHAVLSDCRQYRYALSRTWDHSKEALVVIGLNPSTGDENLDDPTIRRCVNYAKDWGFGSLVMINLFAYRATKPAVTKAQKDPIGADNDLHIRLYTWDAGMVLAAWGNDGMFKDRARKVAEMVPNLMCLEFNKNGQPAHPLYQRKDAKPVPYIPEKKQ